MTPFERALRERIKGHGPITLEAYMEACNAYYYATRDPLGSDGDFTTSPEISQMFGELVGACLADCWNRGGRPANAIYVELGPGRGTLAADALRLMTGAGFKPAAHLVETSPHLRLAQAQAVPGAIFHDAFDHLPDAPLLIVANEFLDALPIRQFVDGRERHVRVAGGGLAFDRDGAIFEDSPMRDAAVEAIARRLVEQGGVALIIDYGHERSAPGDTLQAVRRHAYAPVLDNPGEQDLTSHVDFEAVARAASIAGAAVTPLVRQGQWLDRLGVGERAKALAARHPERAGEIGAACDRLCNPDAMGNLFKVIAIHAPSWPVPAGFQ